MSVKKVLLALLALFVLGALALGVLVAVLLPRYVEGEVVAEAEARGVQLVPGEISFGLGWLQISDAKLTLIGVPGLRATASIIDVELARMVPLRFTVNDFKVDAVGDPIALARALDAWRSAHEKSFSEPVFIKPLTVSLRPSPKAEPLLEVGGGEMRIEKERSSLRATKVSFLGRQLGPSSVSMGKNALRVNVTLGLSALENPLVTLDVHSGAEPAVHFGLSPITLGKLGTFLGKELPLPEVLLSGAVDATQAPNTSPPAGVSGRADFTLKNYVPPHPPELDGFVFGNATDFGARFTLEPEKSRVRLENAVVKAGNFVLEGAGEFKLEGERGRLILLLRGALPCNLLAGAAAETRLGRALGRVSGKAAREVLAGSVGIRVAIDADASDLAHARALKTITPGCGLKPLSLNELRALGELLPEALDPAVAKDLDALLKNPLPALPNLGPDTKLNLPNLNALPLPLPQLQLPAPAQTRTKKAAPSSSPAPAPSAGR